MERDGAAPLRRVGLSPARQAIVLAYGAWAIAYLGWRTTTINPQAVLYSWIVLALEAGGVLVAFLHLYQIWAVTARTPPEPRPDVTVEVLVLTDGRSVDVVRRTLQAALAMAHAHGVCLVDPSASGPLQGVARDLGVRYSGPPSPGASRGQCLNHAVQGQAAEIVVVFDADHAPRPDFLSRTLGYFEDPQVAFVQTPEDAYNLDSYEHWLQRKNGVVWSEESLEQKVVQPGRDRFNGAVLGETCALLRRRSLDQVGGFADSGTGALRRTSIRLHKRGLRSVYHNESLAFGLAPADLGTFLHQRVVQARDGLALWAGEGILLSPGLTLPQRLAYLGTVLPTLNGWARGLLYVLPGIILWTGVLPIATRGLTFLTWFVPYFVLGVWAYEGSGRGYGRWLLAELYEVARFYGLAMTLVQRPSAAPRGSVSLTVPHLVLSCLNLSGVAVGLLNPLIELHGPMSPVALGVCSVWAFCIFTLSAWVMQSVEQPRRRSEYRFPIPLPISLQTPAGPLMGTVDDVSSGGLRIHARFDPTLVVGTELLGELYVPDGIVHVNATVTTLHHGQGGRGDYVKSVGCKVDWKDPADRDRLERLLYGSDLQLSVMGLGDQHSSMVDQVGRLFEGRAEPPRSWRLWAPVTYAQGDGSRAVGLISNGEDASRERHLLLFSPAPRQPDLEVCMVTRTGETAISCRVARETRIETALSPIFFYELNADAPAPAARR